ncbi:MAG: hypothetical protein HOO85_09170 [Methylotenera sp.]|nr:hypothetical protein [Methylotenera sp.]
MQRENWPDAVRLHLAIASVGNSTLMMQSGKGRVARAQKFLISEMSLKGLTGMNELAFAEFLNKKTEALSLKLLKPEDDQPNWGAARKVINIFLRLCAMNKDLHLTFNLASIEQFLEVPLDSQIVAKVDEKTGSKYAPKFRIKNLNPQLNQKIQDAAMLLANMENLNRYELDVLYWNSQKHA